MNSLELFFHNLYQYEMAKQGNQNTEDTQGVESPILDMSFDFADAPPAIINQSNENEKRDNKKERKEKEETKPKKLSIRKVNPPKPIKKQPTKEDKVEPKKMSKSMKRVRNNLRI